MQAADHRPCDDPDDNCDDPNQRMPQPQPLWQYPDLRDRHYHCAKAEDRANGQVDVPGHDNQHHARCHDADGGGLYRKVPEVARREERAKVVHQCAVEMKPDPDQPQRAHHAEQPGIDLGRAHETREWADMHVEMRESAFGASGTRTVAHLSLPCMPAGIIGASSRVEYRMHAAETE